MATDHDRSAEPLLRSGTIEFDELEEALDDETTSQAEFERAFQVLLEDGAARPDDIADSLVGRIAADDTNRFVASRMLVALARDYPESIDAHVDSLCDAADDTLVGDKAIQALQFLAREEPGAVIDQRARLVSLLETELPATREGAATILVTLSESDATAFARFTEQLYEAASRSVSPVRSNDSDAGTYETERIARDQKRRTRETDARVPEAAAVVLARVAAATPDSVEPLVEELVDLGSSDAPSFVRERALDSVLEVALHRPAAVDGSLERLVALLETAESEGIGARAVLVLGACADADTEAVTACIADGDGAVVALRTLLDSDDRNYRRATVSLIGYLAEGKPEACESIRPALFRALDDEHRSVRAGAVLALEFLLESTDDREIRQEILGRLEATATEEDDSDVRALAANAVAERTAD